MVSPGIDNLIAQEFRPLQGARIGLVTNHTGVTNLPVNLTFRARTLKFSAYRTNYLGQLELNVSQDGKPDGSVSINNPARGVMFYYDDSKSGVTSFE